jgi:hypothetical protein
VNAAVPAGNGSGTVPGTLAVTPTCPTGYPNAININFNSPSKFVNPTISEVNAAGNGWNLTVANYTNTASTITYSVLCSK